MTSRQFEQFVATERGMLVRLAMNILHHPEDADDAVAEALCKAWERREQLRSPDKMRSWVAKITVNIYVYDKDVPQMGASLKYFVQTKSAQVYVFGYNIDKDRVESLWITSDFEKIWAKEIADKKTMRKKDGLQIKIFNCMNQ